MKESEESSKKSRNPNPVAATRGKEPSVPLRPPRKSYTSYSRSSTFDTIDEEGTDQPVKILIEDDSNSSGTFQRKSFIYLFIITARLLFIQEFQNRFI